MEAAVSHVFRAVGKRLNPRSIDHCFELLARAQLCTNSELASAFFCKWTPSSSDGADCLRAEPSNQQAAVCAARRASISWSTAQAP